MHLSLIPTACSRKYLAACLALASFPFLTILQAQEVMKIQKGAAITVQNGSEMLIMGGVTLENGSTLLNNGNITLKQNGASGTANWTDYSSVAYHYGTGKWNFNGSGGHSLSSPNSFEQIEVDASGHITLASDIRSHKWLLTNGKVNTSRFSAIAAGTGELDVEAAAGNPNFTNSWFNGNLRRYLKPAAVNQYVFPVGDASKPNPAVLDNLSADPLTNLSYIDVAFGPKPGTDVGLIAAENGKGYVSVNSGGVWYLTADKAPASGTYDLQLYFNGFTGLNDNSFGILMRPDLSADASGWTVPAGSVTPDNNQPGRIISSGFARRNALHGFNQFGIGTLSGSQPVHLLGFDAQRVNNLKVLVNWETVSENNSKGFDVERRLDGETVFTRIGFTASKATAGKSIDRIDYQFTDANGFTGISYYRLKQVDIDNSFTYTHIKAVKGLGQTQVSVMLYPNPNYGQFTIRLDGVNRSYDAMITDMGGKLLRQLKLSNSTAINITGLSAGTYIIRIPDVFGPGEAFTEKVLVVK